LTALALLIAARPARVATQFQQQDERRTKLEKLRIETFDGDAVTFRVKQLRKGHKAIARAMKDAEKKGLRPAFAKGRVILATEDKQTASPTAFAANLKYDLHDLMQPISFRTIGTQPTLRTVTRSPLFHTMMAIRTTGRGSFTETDRISMKTLGMPC
jgi:hypothetical protein